MVRGGAKPWGARHREQSGLMVRAEQMSLDRLTQDEVSGLFRNRRGGDRGRTGLETWRAAFVRGTKVYHTICSVGV